MPDILDEFESIPVGSLGIIAMHGCEELGSKIDSYLVQWRAQRENEHKSTIAFAGYQRGIGKHPEISFRWKSTAL